MSELIIQSGKLLGKRLVLPEKDMVVGRDEDCDLRISSSLVSRKHCKLRVTDHGIMVTDLGSQNGTYINDIAITEPTLLDEGDLLRIGATLLAVPAKAKPKRPMSREPRISDAEIANWLTEPGNVSSSGDTAVIPAFSSERATPAPASQPTPPPPTIKAQPTNTKVRSVKEEAELIIRKHWEAVRLKQKNS